MENVEASSNSNQGKYLVITMMIIILVIGSAAIRFFNKDSMDVIKSGTSEEEDIRNEIKAVNNRASYLYSAMVITLIVVIILVKYIKSKKGSESSDSSDGSGGVLNTIYGFFKTLSPLQKAMVVAFFLGGTGKLIEGWGFKGCFNDIGIDSPSSILLFDMFFTNTFAYFFDLVLAFIGAVALDTATNITDSKTETLLINTNINLLGWEGFKNFFRFIWYLVIIIAFWNLASLVRPKVQILIEMFLGFDPISTKDIINASVKNAYRCEDLKEPCSSPDPNKDVLIFGTSHKYSEDSFLVKFMNGTKGIITAGTVEAIVFLSVLYPLRHYYLYELGPKGKEGFVWWKEVGKFILALLGLAFIFFFTRFLAYGKNIHSWRDLPNLLEPEDNKKEHETSEFDYNKLAEKSINDDCKNSKYQFYTLASIIFILVLGVVCSPVFKSSGWEDGSKLIVSLILYFVLSFGSVILISNFLFPKEGDTDDDDENSITNRWWFILNPGRKDYNSFKNVLLSFGIAAFVYFVMYLLGTTFWTKKEAIDNMNTPKPFQVYDESLRSKGGGKSKRVKRKSYRKKR